MPKRIIVIDNDQSILEMLQEALEEEGYQVMTFRDTNDIVTLVRQYPADLLIVDYILEGINGGELCRQLKKERSTANLPVMICSGYSKVLNSLGFYDCDAFLEKPFDLAELMLRVQQLITPLKTLHSN